MSSGRALFSGRADTAQTLELTLSLPLRNQPELESFLREVNDRNSPLFHHYLSVDEFDQRFGPTEESRDQVVAWAKSKGFIVRNAEGKGRLVSVEGSVDAINRAFGILLSNYREPKTGRVFFSPDKEPTLDLPLQLLAISGLDNATPRQTHLRAGDHVANSSGTAAPQRVTSQMHGSGPSNTYIPSDLRAAYYGSGPLTGAGQSVAIFSYDGYLQSDLQLYYRDVGMSSAVPVNNVLVNGYSGACTGVNGTGACDDGEQILDIANVIGMAPGLDQVLFYEGTSSTDVLNKIAMDDIAKVISNSWGGGDFGAASDPIFLQFQAQGQTFVSASGDDGVYASGVLCTQTSGSYCPPELDPNITQVGGTTLNTVSAGGAWSSEAGWIASGGGYLSGTYGIPSYQQAPGVVNSLNQGSVTLRNTPDVSAEADYDNTTVSNGTFLYGYGGTSFAAPRWAGIVALANQQAATNGVPPVGFLAQSVYSIGAGANYNLNLHDITSGNNGFPGNPGFNAVTGYDLVTGWGSPNGPALIDTLAPIPPPPGPWQAQFSRQFYSYNCSVQFALFLNQETSTSSLSWSFYLYDNISYGAPVFDWTLADSQGTIASGTWNSTTTGSFPPFTVSRAPVGTPTFTMNGYYSGNGCYLQLSGSGTLTHQ